ncbi:MAG: LytTR family DNA-binding domain-containing protein [Gemmatimonadetes bacterium]|nr:LytTR family DNA-binding domain-containing protein [Gemmatimonadota bacterium]NNF37955.1 response regulator transcription factor [Gemmatimonadota bacterium]
MTTLSVLIVDDEAPARQRLRDLLRAVPGIDLLGECDDGPSAVDAIVERSPDVVFLDVQMPEMSGFDVLHALEPERMPMIVFVTAYDRHAVAAFEAGALDYLLKPFTEDRFRASVERVRERLEREGPGAERERVRRWLAGGGAPSGRIVVRSGSRIRFVEVAAVLRIEAEGNYVRLHTAEGDHLVRGSLRSFASRLSPAGFVRVHNSHVVNWARVQELERWGHGEYRITLEGGDAVVSSRTYASDIQQLLG